MRKITVLLFSWFLIANIAHAETYHWQDISFTYQPEAWSLLTDRTINNIKIIHMHQSNNDGYPISILLGLVPKTSKGSGFLKPSKGKSANTISTRFTWPLLKRYSKTTRLSERLITLNEIDVSHQMSPGAIVTIPTPQKDIFVSAQTFHHENQNYYVVGGIVTRTDKGIMRRSENYADRIERAYKIIANIQIN